MSLSSSDALDRASIAPGDRRTKFDLTSLEDRRLLFVGFARSPCMAVSLKLRKQALKSMAITWNSRSSGRCNV